MGSARTAFPFAALALFSAAHANPHEYLFSNGLRLTFKEDHRAPAGEFPRRVNPGRLPVVIVSAAQ
jgi:hypothetical protein